MIGTLFAIGYGSVVAAGGWEALRVPVNPNDIDGGASNDDSVCGSSGGGGGGRGGGAGGASSGGRRGDRGDGCLADKDGDFSFAEQVCARDSRAEEEAHANGDDEDDDDDELDSSEPGSGFADMDVRQHRAASDARTAAAAATAASTARMPTTTAAGGNGTPRTAPMTRSQTRGAHFKRDVDADVGGDGGVGGSDGGVDDDISGGAVYPGHVDGAVEPEPMSAAGIGGIDRMNIVHQAASYDSTEPEDEEDEEDDDGGWGQVVVKPVKVSRWDKQGQRSKALLSLTQLRALIIQRAESTAQKATYYRASKLVS